MNEAVRSAVEECIDRDILADILEQNKMEVVGMLLTEFNERRYKRLIKKLAREEGWEEGRAEGHAAGRAEGHAEGRAEGHAAGRAEGHAAGRAEGHAAGRAEGRAEDIKNLMDTMKLSVEQAMDALRIPEEKREEYRERIERK